MYRAGIDLGGTNLKAGIVDEQQKILAEASIPTKAERPALEIIKDMASLVSQLLENLTIVPESLIGIGVGSPGIVDAQAGIVRYSNNINWENIPLVDELKKCFRENYLPKKDISIQCAISNDANCAALGEVKAGAAKDVRNAILLTLGTGVGGGIILDGKVFEGCYAGGAELGHTSLIFGGEPCTCGRRGCVEAYVSATALIRDAKAALKANPDSLMHQLCNGDPENINGKIPFDAAWAGDTPAKKVVDNYIMYLGEAIANYVNIFRPDVVLLSGGICNQKEKLTDPVSAYLADKCLGTDKAWIPPVRCAILGNQAGMIGAANLIG